MAVRKVTDDEAELLAFLRLPRRLDLLRTTNPIESATGPST
ncbi:hypothetical protein [Streptomyces sp. NBC_00829]|nr:hypothetical protein OG293_03080 [Streptomyces sp. NBC_00829]